MIIKALKTFSDGAISLHEGEIANVPDAKAQLFINAGYAVEYTGEGGTDDITDAETNDGFLLADEANNVGVHIGTVEDWKNASYLETYGFGGYPYGYKKLPPKNKFSGIVESDMIAIDGGKGRWNGTDTGNAVCGGHLLEGWNALKDARLTFGIGMQHKDTAFISVFHPHSTSAQNDGYYGVVKVGDDRKNTGTVFSQSLMKCQGLFCLATSIPNDSTTSTQKIVETGELQATDYNATDNIPYGAMYFDATEQKVKVYTTSGWKTLSWEA